MQIIRVIKKFSGILSKNQKVKIILLGILMLIGGGLEMLSVSLILPYMELILEPEKAMNKWFFKSLCDIIDIDSTNTFLFILSICLAILYILKNLYLMFEYSIQYKFVYGNMFSLQSKLLNCFLHRSYEYYLSVDSGEIIRIIDTDTTSSFALLTTLLTFFTELIVSIILIVTVFVVAPVLTIWMAMILFCLVLIINHVLKPILRAAGKKNQRAIAGMNRWMIQSIQGIKELIVMQKEDFFLKNFNRYGSEKVETSRINSVLSVVPKFMIEALTMSSMFLIIGVMIYNGAEIEKMIPGLSALAMAALRILPSANRMSGALVNISYIEPTLDKLIENLNLIQDGENVVFNEFSAVEKTKKSGHVRIKGAKENIRLLGISYKYPASEKYVLHNADMSIQIGESIGLIGASGMGKTTAVDIILGLLKPQLGQVLVDGVDIEEDMEGWLSCIGYVPQTIFMLNGSIRENVAFGASGDVTDDRVWEALRESALEDFVRELPEGLDTEIGERGVRLSGGQRQRIGIARALFLNPSILILDEATSALDSETEQDIMESIDHLHGKKTMIIIAHRFTTIEKCDHVYRVENCKIKMEI